ncbi:MAG: hypothetical protein HOP07_14915 [Bacteriovoracaceae bacterium]|nr:hypothetical protein [Bacteriovoracaceae bacterium]
MNDMENYYNFEAIFCNKAAGWEKGSVENGVGYCRRNFLPGLPSFETMNSLNNYLKMCSHQDLGKITTKKIQQKKFYTKTCKKSSSSPR